MSDQIRTEISALHDGFVSTSQSWERYAAVRRDFEKNRPSPSTALELRRSSLLTQLESQQNEILANPQSDQLAPLLELSLDQAIKTYSATNEVQLRLITAGARSVDERLAQARAAARQRILADRIAGVLTVTALLATVVLMFFAAPDEEGTAVLPLFEVPIAIAAWGLLGAALSVVIRFGSGRLTELSEPLRWVMARPVIGVATGVLVFLLLTTLWSVIGVSSSTHGLLPLTSLLAFLAGASERFTEVSVQALSHGVRWPSDLWRTLKGLSKAVHGSADDDPSVPATSSPARDGVEASSVREAASEDAVVISAQSKADSGNSKVPIEQNRLEE